MSAIVTPYYRPIGKRFEIGCVAAPIENYKPYDLFVLKTRLMSKISEMLGESVQMRFINVKDGGKMNVTLQFFDMNDVSFEGNVVDVPLELSDSQRVLIERWMGEVLSYNPEFVFIDPKSFKISSDIPSLSWILSVVPYLVIDEKYNSYVNDEGIFVELDPDSDYLSVFNALNIKLMEQLKEMYDVGVVVGGSELADLSEKWQLAVMDVGTSNPEVYYPRWKDERFAPNLVDFMLERMYGSKHITVEMPDSDVARHYIAIYLDREEIPYKFNGHEVLVEAEGLNEARMACSIISRALSELKGRVMVIRHNNKGDVDKYKDDLERLYGNYCVIASWENIGDDGYYISCDLKTQRVPSSIDKNNKRLMN